MLLRNDVVEGREVASLQAADELYLSHKRHIARVKEQFGLVHDMPGHALVRYDVTPEFRQQLRGLLDVYVRMHESPGG